jgi:transposase
MSARQTSLRQRHLIECGFSKLQQFRRIETCYEKIARNDRAMIALAATILWLK